MSNGHGTQRLPVLVTIVLSLLLAFVPLPDALQPFRPDWVALTLIYWAMMLPRVWSIGSAWIVGLLVDVGQGTILGQHALAISVVVFLTARFHLQMRVFPISQLSATIFALLSLYQFLLFWINGVAGIEAPGHGYWGPVLTGTAVWPLIVLFLGSVRSRMLLGR